MTMKFINKVVDTDTVKAWIKTEYPTLRAKGKGVPIVDNKALEGYLRGLKNTCKAHGIDDKETDQIIWGLLSREVKEMTVPQSEETGESIMSLHLLRIGHKSVEGKDIPLPLPYPTPKFKKRW